MNRSILNTIRRAVVGFSLLAALLTADHPVFARQRALPNFNLIDLKGRNHEFHRAEGKAVVLFFTGNGCPVARQSISKLKSLHDRFDPDVTFWVVNTYLDDTLEDCRKEYRDFKMSPLTYLRDPKQGLALALGVERTAEVVALRTSDGTVFYQGAIDDQLSEGAQRRAPQAKYLEDALTAFLANKPVAVPSTKAHGCLVTFASVGGADGQVAYGQHVAPVLSQHCAECHREGGIGPWAMDGYGRAKNYARMMEEVLLTGQMPPWHADPAYGHWANDRSLTAEETQTLLRWIAAGAPRGEGPDPLAAPLPAVSEWSLGRPDFTIKLPKPEEIPANGVLDYRHITVDLPITNDVWLAGLEVKPGNHRVVHHVIVRAKWDGGPDDGSSHGVNLAGWAPGLVNARFPAGTGKFVPRDAKIDLEIHYTTSGSPQTDQTEVAFYVLPAKPERELFTRAAIQTDLNIPPGADESRDGAIYAFERPATIYDLMPHMHLRGSWMRFDLLLPNSKHETLLNVPRYDFNWQTVYHLAVPRHVPAGAWLVVTGGFDNSAGNPGNPDPHKRIHFGQQSWDEMFIGFFDVADDPARPVETSAPAKRTAQLNATDAHVASR
jgi:mono/diheme cytochrome c family protein